MTREFCTKMRALGPVCSWCGEKYQFPMDGPYTPLGQLQHVHQDEEGKLGEKCEQQIQGTLERRAEYRREVLAQLENPDDQRNAEILQEGNLPKRTMRGLNALTRNEANAESVDAVRRYCDEWRLRTHPGDGRGLYLFGKNPGNGKTTAATALGYDLIRYGGAHMHPRWHGQAVYAQFPKPAVKFYKLFDLFEEQKMSFKGETEFDPTPIKTCDLLILDEMGKLPPTAWNLPVLFSWLDIRDSELLPTVYTSNYSLQELVERYIEALGVEYKRDVLALRDRIAGNCEQVEFTGASWRLG